MADSEEEFAAKARIPLKEGKPIKGVTYDLEEHDEDVMKATFKYVWS